MIAPIARALVRLGVTANEVTVLGAVGTVIVSLLAGITGWLLPCAVVLGLLVAFDSLDGSVAALTGGGTQFGAFLDSTLDRIADWAVLVGVIIYFFVHVLDGTGPASSGSERTWALVGIGAALFAIMTSFVTSYARARAEAEGFEAKNGIATRSDRLVIILVGMALTGAGLPTAVLACFMVALSVLGVITVWQRIRRVDVSMGRHPHRADPSHE